MGTVAEKQPGQLCRVAVGGKEAQDHGPVMLPTAAHILGQFTQHTAYPCLGLGGMHPQVGNATEPPAGTTTGAQGMPVQVA